MWGLPFRSRRRRRGAGAQQGVTAEEGEGRPLAGQVALVTGATSGIGREAARRLAQLGAAVLLGCRDTRAAERVAAEIRAGGKGMRVAVGPQLDLGEPRSIEAFAAALTRSHRALHLLVNNAGANYLPAGSATRQGVPLLVQVNYLGPYHLTRLLQRQLRAGAPARVVNVSSVTHRYGLLDSARRFLFRDGTDSVGRGYPATKLANVLFTHELQRRWGPEGVQAAAVDPGAVATNIYRNSRLKGTAPAGLLLRALYAPPSDGCAAVVAACTAPWLPCERRDGREPCGREELRFYARGAFATRAVTAWRGPAGDRVGLGAYLWAASTLALSLVDWPVRRLTGLWAKTRRVPAVPAVYDEALAAELWDRSAALCGVTR